MATVLITGKTWPVRGELKAIGATWDARSKGWRVPVARADEARAIVAGRNAPVAAVAPFAPLEALPALPTVATLPGPLPGPVALVTPREWAPPATPATLARSYRPCLCPRCNCDGNLSAVREA